MSQKVCNITARGQARRMGLGLVMAAVTLATGAALYLLAAPRPWRLMVFLPTVASAHGVLQARAKT